MADTLPDESITLIYIKNETSYIIANISFCFPRNFLRFSAEDRSGGYGLFIK